MSSKMTKRILLIAMFVSRAIFKAFSLKRLISVLTFGNKVESLKVKNLVARWLDGSPVKLNV